MKNLSSGLAWLNDIANSAMLGSLGGVLAAHAYDAIQTHTSLFFGLTGFALSALVAAGKLDV